MKGQIRFSCKMYIGKKKSVFHLDMTPGKAESLITGELIEGDIKSYENIFGQIKDKLES